MKHVLATSLLALLPVTVMSDVAPEDVQGRWGGQCDFPGWPSLFCVLTLDGADSTLSSLPAQLIDQPVTEWKSDGDGFAFEVDIHGTVFAFNGSQEADAITGTIGKASEVTEGSMSLVPYPIVSSMHGAKRWSGALDVQGAMKIKMLLDTATGSADRLHADLSIPTQQLLEYPLKVEMKPDDMVLLTLPVGSGSAVIELAWGGEELAGKYTQGAFTQDIVFVPDSGATTSFNRPQEPKPPFPYESRDVLVKHPEGHSLAGTLTIPEGEGPHPAAILISGSGLQDRNEELMGHKPFLVLADHLTRNGIAVLRADDRGVGDSFVPERSTLEDDTSMDYASDISVLVEHLKQQPEVDVERIGLIGHSEGGLIGPIVADQRGDVAYLVLMAGPGRPGVKVLKDQLSTIMEVEGVDAETIDQVMEKWTTVMNLVMAGVSDEDLREPMRELSILQLSAMGIDIEVDDAFIDKAIGDSSHPWLKFFMEHDPADVLSRLDMPIFAINGSLDVQVIAEHELPVIEEAVRAGGGQVTTRNYPGLNHLFQPAETGAVDEYEEIEITIDPGVLEDMSDWINERMAEGG